MRPTLSRHEIDALLERPRMQLLSTLRARVGYARFKDRALRIAGFDGRHISRELRWLCNLGFLDIERDLRGKWTSLVPTPYAAYRLPDLTTDGEIQVILTGSPSHRYAPLLRQALEIGLAVDWQDQPGGPQLVPPRIRVRASTEEEFLALLDQLHHDDQPVYQRGVAAKLFAEWAGDIVGWRSTLRWWDTDILSAEKYYVPKTFQTRQVSPSQATGELKLAIVGFQYDQDTKLHVLGRYGAGVHCQQSSFVGDPAWGKWEAQHSGMNFFRKIAGFNVGPIPIPYHNGDLVLPDGLILPYMLARAVFLCSGFVPVACLPHPAWSSSPPGPQGPFFNVESPYQGLCWEYSQVPLQIATTVLAKVGAVPTSWV